MRAAGVSGIHATTKGLHHGFGVREAPEQIPLTLIRQWMGHADAATTAIYLAVRDDEGSLSSKNPVTFIQLSEGTAATVSKKLASSLFKPILSSQNVIPLGTRIRPTKIPLSDDLDSVIDGSINACP
jgi:hypothetical protein